MKKILLLFILLLISNSFSQDISQLRVVGKAELMSGELIDKSIRDANGAICSGLIIVSDLTGLTFQSSNGIVKINSKPGNDFLFLSPDERVVTVYCTGYKPLQIILNEVGVKLKSGEVWKVEITGDKKVDLFPVVILTKPEGTIKIIDGENKGDGTSFQLSGGKHNLMIEKTGYETIEYEIDVNSLQLVFNFTLKEITQQIVEIRSVPKEANIFIDELTEGITDNQIFRFPGKYKLRLTKSGYLDIDEEIEVNDSIKNKFTFELIKNSSTLNLTVVPSDAEVEINNKSYGTQRTIELSAGNHFLVIKKNGYRENRESILIELGKPVIRTITLEAITGNLQVKVFPIDAEVKLIREGREVDKWTGAKILNDILVGNYNIDAKLEGYERNSKNIIVEENKTTQEEISLTKSVTTSQNILSDNTIIGECGSPIIYEGKTYNTVKIGSQCWLKENLDVGITINGKQPQRDKGTIEKYCYNNNEAYCDMYGGLYQWEEAMQYVATEGSQGICPKGWHIPTSTEFEILKATVNNDGNSLKALVQGTVGSVSSDGFSALFAGGRFGNGVFKNSGTKSYFWSSSEGLSSIIGYMYLSSSDSIIDLSTNYGENGYSIRCIED